MDASNRISTRNSALPQFVSASMDEIRYAEELRRQIEQRYLSESNREPEPHRRSAGSV
jgi:hypothetical protein